MDGGPTHLTISGNGTIDADFTNVTNIEALTMGGENGYIRAALDMPSLRDIKPLLCANNITLALGLRRSHNCGGQVLIPFQRPEPGGDDIHFC